MYGLQGVEKISDYPIMFHGITPRIMRNLAWYTYHMKIYGHRQRSYPKVHEYYTSRNDSVLQATTPSWNIISLQFYKTQVFHLVFRSLWFQMLI